MIDLFTQQFPTIAQMVEDSETFRLDIVEPFENRIGVGDTGTVLFRHRNGRAFGAIWRAERGTLNGLGARNFDSNLPDDHPANESFLKELARRLTTHGATQGEIVGLAGGGFQRRHREKYRRELETRAF